MTERLPPPNSTRIRATVPTGGEVVTLPAGTVIVRVHRLEGDRRQAWHELRSFGPTTSRFDHHPLPRRNHPRRRITYATTGVDAFVAVLAEWFQDDGGGIAPFDLKRERPAITAFETAATVTLLDLDSGWVTRAGGNQAIRTGPRAASRAWARMIYRHHPDVAGLAYGSSVWGPGRCLALWERSIGMFPPSPVATRQLDDPTLIKAVVDAARRLGTFVID